MIPPRPSWVHRWQRSLPSGRACQRPPGSCSLPRVGRMARVPAPTRRARPTRHRRRRPFRRLQCADRMIRCWSSQPDTPNHKQPRTQTREAEIGRSCPSSKKMSRAQQFPPMECETGSAGAGRSRPSHSRIQLLSACGASACAFQAPHAAALPNSPAKLSDRCCWRIHAAKCARSAETEAELTTNRRATRRDAISEPAVQSSGTYARMRSRLRIADLNRRAPSCSER